MSHRVGVHLRHAPIASLAIFFLFAFGAAPALASDPRWGYHDKWSWYCYSKQTGKVTGISIIQLCPLFMQKVSAQEQIAKAGRTGAQTIRINTRWTEGWAKRRPPGHSYPYGWGPLDRRYEAARALGIRPLIVVLGAPVWARRPGWRGHCPSVRPCAYPPRIDFLPNFQRWVEALMRRYPDALGIEVWNEPNVARFWAPRPMPKLYARVLRRVHAARAETGFRGRVILGGLAPARADGSRRASDVSFLRNVYRRAKRAWFDGIGTHPHPTTRPWVANMNRVIDRLLRIRNARSHGRAKLWLTEVGVRGGGPGFRRRTVAPLRQGPVLKRLYEAAARRPAVAAVYFFSLTETPSEGPYFQHFGVVGPDQKPKPAFCYLRVSLGGEMADGPCSGAWWLPR